MCLNTKKSVYSVAEKDIICYKVLLLRDGEFMTPYRKTPIQKIVVDGKMPFFADGEKSIKRKRTDLSNLVIGEGFIHTYKHFRSASDFKSLFEVVYQDSCCAVFECEIPVGTKYYEGQDDFFETFFASEKIMFKKQLV